MTKHAIRHFRLQPSSANAGIPQWPSYTGESKLVGQSSNGRLTVYVDPTLGPQGLANANSLLKDADRVIDANDAIFGTTGGPTSVIIFALDGHKDGSGGADHGGCDYNVGAAIEVCAAFGEPQRVSALFEAELSECSMGGNLCGLNTGEALSRWCAMEISDNALSDFATGPAWVAGGQKNFVDQIDPTDQNPESTGCGMVFISWLQSLGFALNQIAPAMADLGDGGTFATLYNHLTQKDASSAWADFMAAVGALSAPISDDDPFAGVTPQVTSLQGVSRESAERLLSIVMDSLAAGHSAERLADRLAGAMAMAKVASPKRRAPAKACTLGSHRLEKAA